MAEHYQHFLSIWATWKFNYRFLYVFPTTITDELILFILAIKIYKHTQNIKFYI